MNEVMTKAYELFSSSDFQGFPEICGPKIAAENIKKIDDFLRANILPLGINLPEQPSLDRSKCISFVNGSDNRKSTEISSSEPLFQSILAQIGSSTQQNTTTDKSSITLEKTKDGYEVSQGNNTLMEIMKSDPSHRTLHEACFQILPKKLTAAAFYLQKGVELSESVNHIASCFKAYLTSSGCRTYQPSGGCKINDALSNMQEADSLLGEAQMQMQILQQEQMSSSPPLLAGNQYMYMPSPVYYVDMPSFVLQQPSLPQDVLQMQTQILQQEQMSSPPPLLAGNQYMDMPSLVYVDMPSFVLQQPSLPQDVLQQPLQGVPMPPQIAYGTQYTHYIPPQPEEAPANAADHQQGVDSFGYGR